MVRNCELEKVTDATEELHRKTAQKNSDGDFRKQILVLIVSPRRKLVADVLPLYFP